MILVLKIFDSFSIVSGVLRYKFRVPPHGTLDLRMNIRSVTLRQSDRLTMPILERHVPLKILILALSQFIFQYIPILFLVHIKNIAFSLSAGTFATYFADDTRVQRGVSSSTDCVALQADLNQIYQWAESVNMQFNSSKFECLRFWPNQGKASKFQYTAFDNSPIEV